MTCINWPENPAAGQQFTFAGITYTWDGEKWNGNSDIFNYDRETRWSSVSLTANPGNPTTNPTNWNSSGDATSNWKAERERRTGAWTQWVVTKLRGSDAVDSFTSFVFRRSALPPATPTGGTFNSPVPTDWHDGIPAGELQVWMSIRIFYSDGSENVVGHTNYNAWTPPTSMTDTFTVDYEWSSVEGNPGTPASNPENWSNVASESTIWKAERYKVNGQWGTWTVVKIRGENGNPGSNGTSSNLPFTSFCFKRSATVPATPPASEGSWVNPVPAGWEDGVPSGELQLYQIQRIFTNNGLSPQSPTWSTPVAITNTSTAEYKWSSVQVNPGTPTSNPENWSDVGGATTVWQAFRQIINGVVGAWQIIKIKGESGNSVGRGFNFFKIGTASGLWSDTDALSALPDNTPVVNDVVTIYKLTDTRINVTKFWNGAAWELPADGGLFLGSIIVDGSVISRHLAASLSLTTPRVNGGTLNGTFLQLFGTNIMIIESPTPFGPDNLIYWVGAKATTGSTPDTIAPVYTAVTKALGKFWIDKDGNVGIRGQVIATSGEFNNVTIKENCTILGKLSVGNIEGVITKAQLITLPAKKVTATPAGGSPQWKPIAKVQIAANPYGLDSTVAFNSLPLYAQVTKGYESRDPITPVLLRVKVNGTLDPRTFRFSVPWFNTAPAGGAWPNGFTQWAGAAVGNFNLAIPIGKATALIEIETDASLLDYAEDDYIEIVTNPAYITLLPTSSEVIGTAIAIP